MNFEPFDVTLIAQRLREQIPKLTSVAGVAEFSQVKELRGFRTPSAYVLQAVEKPGVNGPRGARVQPAQTNFGVAIAVNNYRSEMDASTTDELRSIVGAVRTALIGWTPPVPGVTPVGWIGGEVVDFDDIAHGHQRSDLGCYTERQLKLFYRQALQLERQRSAMRMLDVNAGMAGGDAAKERLNELSK